MALAKPKLLSRMRWMMRRAQGSRCTAPCTLDAADAIFSPAMIICPLRQENYPGHVCRCVAQELLRVRLKREFSPRDLAVPSLLSGQTVRNSEELIHSPRLFTLALHASGSPGSAFRVRPSDFSTILNKLDELINALRR
jgi:hypothetical protein